ncbi:hypothetical protein KBY55_14360 [Streptomyces sp. b94]|uniref:hypothetical protein n=1 Tax=Streptomyces sp. b94 TaxID=1827634 RepID=UPI001B3769DD|nr:hypothetical protein [Streptomyces sp. b94]
MASAPRAAWCCRVGARPAERAPIRSRSRGRAGSEVYALLPIENGGETAAMFCWSFLLVAAIGPGSRALAPLLRPRRRTATRPIRTTSLH